VLDLFNREVMGWPLKPRMTADIVIDALTMAWFRRRPEAGVMHHSDRGSQYASHAFQDKLKEFGMICSMSRKGNCWGVPRTRTSTYRRLRCFTEDEGRSFGVGLQERAPNHHELRG
jgi:putative transposase